MHYENRFLGTFRGHSKRPTWSSSNNLVLNPNKTKVMLFSTSQLSRVHQLDDDRSVHLHAIIELKRLFVDRPVLHYITTQFF